MKWKGVEGFEDRYKVSDLGEIKSLDFFDSWGRLRKGRILKVPLDKRGYPRVSISKGGLKKAFRIHRLVATAFIPNPENLPQVNHKDGNKLNNHVDNLEWCDNSHNVQHAYSKGLIAIKKREESHNFKGQVTVLNSSGEVVETLVGSEDMIDKGYDPRNISACILGKRKTYKNYTYEREEI